MSLRSACGLNAKELATASPQLRDRILGKLSKIKNLEALTATKMFERDSRRLDARSRAVQQKLLGGRGVDAGSDDDRTVIADDIHIVQPAGRALPLLLSAAFGSSLVLAAAAWLFRPAADPPAKPPPPAASPLDSEYEIRFDDADGQPIKLQPRGAERPGNGKTQTE